MWGILLLLASIFVSTTAMNAHAPSQLKYVYYGKILHVGILFSRILAVDMAKSQVVYKHHMCSCHKTGLKLKLLEISIVHTWAAAMK